MKRQDALAQVCNELDRYHELWKRPDGDWDEPYDKKLRILVEEVGEIASAINDKDWDNLPVEIVQTAAVCIAWLMGDW